MLFYLIKKKKIFDFEDFIFEVEFKISEVIDYEYRYLRFRNCIFCKGVDFSCTKFNSEVEFRDCVFLESIDFSNSVFYRDFIFLNNELKVDYIEDKAFINSIFKSQEIYIEGNSNFPSLEGSILGNSRLIFKGCDYDLSNSAIARANYTIARIQSERVNDIKYLRYYTNCERKYMADLIDKNDFESYGEYLIARILAYISKVFVGYGEYISRLFFTMLFIISLFAAIYMYLGVTTCFGQYIKVDILDIYNYSVFDFLKLYMRFWYFSFMTFSTVGYGDMIVSSVLGEVLVCIEVFIGVIVQSIWTALIIKRMFK